MPLRQATLATEKRPQQTNKQTNKKLLRCEATCHRMRVTQETNPRPVHYSHEVSASKMHDSGSNWHSHVCDSSWSLDIESVKSILV